MSDEVYESFERVVLSKKKTKIEMMIDGGSGFLFLDGRGKPMLAYQWEKKFPRFVEKYNKIYKVELPKITPHTRRYSDYHERIYASQIGRCEGRTGADESKGAVKKGDDFGGHGVCQKGNKTSE